MFLGLLLCPLFAPCLAFVWPFAAPLLPLCSPCSPSAAPLLPLCAAYGLLMECVDVKHSQQMTEAFKNASVDARLLVGTTARGERDQTIGVAQSRKSYPFLVPPFSEARLPEAEQAMNQRLGV